jgi:hypothetical protein
MFIQTFLLWLAAVFLPRQFNKFETTHTGGQSLLYDREKIVIQ